MRVRMRDAELLGDHAGRVVGSHYGNSHQQTRVRQLSRHVFRAYRAATLFSSSLEVYLTSPTSLLRDRATGITLSCQ